MNVSTARAVQATAPEKKPRLSVRPAMVKDVRAIQALCRRAYPSMSPYSQAQLRGQIQNFPEGQFVAIYDDRLVGYAATFLIDEKTAMAPHDWENLAGEEAARSIRDHLRLLNSGEGDPAWPLCYKKRHFEFFVERLHNCENAEWLLIGSDRTLYLERECRRRQNHTMRSLTELTNRIAHDMNNVLSGTLGFSSYLLGRVEKDSDIHKQLTLIEAAAQRGSEITRHLLAFARRHNEQGEWVKPLELLGGLIESCSRRFEVPIRLLPCGTIPDLPGHAAKCRTLFESLLVNAIEASADVPDRAIDVTIEVCPLDGATRYEHDRLDDQRPYLRLGIMDSGPGFAAADRQRILEPYVSAKKRKGDTTGLGLAVAFAAVQDHDGLLCHSRRDGCTHAVAWLPYRDFQDRTQPAEVRSNHRPDSLKGSETLLVIDDEALIRGMLGDVLPRFGYKVLTASGGRKGIELVRERRQEIRLILLDLNMPELSGEETHEELRVIAPEIPVVVFSGYIVPSIRAKMAGNGVRGFIHKPFKNLELLQQIRTMMDQPEDGVAKARD